MAAQETRNIVVCATVSDQLEELVQIVREAGGWSIVPIQWPNANALRSSRQLAGAYMLHSGVGSKDAPCAELQQMLHARPRRQPLIVVGKEPAPSAAPNLWLPEIPTAPLLAALISHWLEGSGRAVSNPGTPLLPFRRKSDMIIGNSNITQQLLHSLDQLAPAHTPVVITGESGVGKELVARALHFCGPRAKEPFIAINCAAIPETLFEAELFGYQRGAFTGAVNSHAGAIEAAHRGTLFLDEIGEMPLAMQSKLLRVLETSTIQRIGSTETKRVQFRLVTATNRNLEAEVKAGRFRDDLYYRVYVYPLHVPPLRERPEDIPPIVTHHLSSIALRENRPALRLTPAALEKLVAYWWPGNVRELLNSIERSVLLAEHNVIESEHVVLPQAARSSTGTYAALSPYREAKQKFEEEYYSQLMRTAGGNISLAAKLGQKTRKEVYDALKRLGLDVTAYRADE
jgi:two-component system response regulator GlrR